jgi:D-tyrosyl-tRNA(Tyr) deacylase
MTSSSTFDRLCRNFLMIGLLQRVTRAAVHVNEKEVASIGPGLLVLVGVQPGDEAQQTSRLLERVLSYRVFSDAQGKMNLSLHDTGGGLLLVPQFTLAADTNSGTRASFTGAAAPAVARERFEALVALARTQHGDVGSGVFGADMQVSLVNNGPVTFWLET